MGYIDFVEQSIAVFAFMGIAYCQRAGGHAHGSGYSWSQGTVALAGQILAIVLSLIVVGVLIAYGYTHFERAFEQGDSTIDANFPVWPSKLIVPVAFSLLWLRLLLQLIGLHAPVSRSFEDAGRRADDSDNRGCGPSGHREHR